MDTGQLTGTGVTRAASAAFTDTVSSTATAATAVVAAIIIVISPV